MEYTLSIGLNVGDREPPMQLNWTLRDIARGLPRGHDIVTLAMGASEWDGKPERFIQARVRAQGTDWSHDAKRFASNLADALDQECVALRISDEDRWWLVDPHSDLKPGGTISQFPAIV